MIKQVPSELCHLLEVSLSHRSTQGNMVAVSMQSMQTHTRRLVKCYDVLQKLESDYEHFRELERFALYSTHRCNEGFGIQFMIPLVAWFL